MNPIAADLERAAHFGRERTLADAASSARSPEGIESAMARTSEHELFTEALLAAAHTRFEEIKTVTK